MEKTVLVRGQEIKLKCSGSIPRIYRMQFNRDVFSDFYKLELDAKKRKKEKPNEEKSNEEKSNESEALFQPEEVAILEMLAYTMAKHADPSEPDTIEEWLDKFDDPLLVYNLIPHVEELWKENNKQTVTAKKKDEPLTEE